MRIIFLILNTSLLILNTSIGAVLLSDLADTIDSKFALFLDIQVTLYIINAFFVLVRSKKEEVKITKILIMYLALLILPINLLILFVLIEEFSFIILFIICIYIFYICKYIYNIYTFYGNYENKIEGFEKNLNKYLGKYYFILNLSSILITILMVFWMAYTMVN